MNRETRRRLEKLQKKSKDNKAMDLVSHDDIKNIVSDQLAQSRSNGIDEGITFNQILTIKVLHDVFGFGKKRIHRYLDALVDNINDISAGDLDFSKLMDATLTKYDLNRSDENE